MLSEAVSWREGAGEIQCPRQEAHNSMSYGPFLKSGMAKCPGDDIPKLGKGLFSRIFLYNMHGNVTFLSAPHS